jgi:threonine/homoserine/homoserine lactone efflux protein
LWFALLIAAAAPLGRMLRQPKILKSRDRLTGGVFTAFGLKLAVSKV